MPYKLPAKYKWKGRKRSDQKWSYFATREEAVKFITNGRSQSEFSYISDMFLKPVRMGT